MGVNVYFPVLFHFHGSKFGSMKLFHFHGTKLTFVETFIEVREVSFNSMKIGKIILPLNVFYFHGSKFSSMKVKNYFHEESSFTSMKVNKQSMEVNRFM